ncbi:MAG: hypothetical protein AAF743_01110 [Planctomycetota bacterium]
MSYTNRVKGHPIRKHLQGRAADLPDAILDAHVKEVRRIRSEQALLPIWSIDSWLVRFVMMFVAYAVGSVLVVVLKDYLGLIPTLLVLFAAFMVWISLHGYLKRGFEQQVVARIHASLGSAQSCFVCGYDVRHHDGSICPECGTDVAVPPAGAVATDALTPATKRSRTNRFHPRLEPLHPTVAAGVRKQIELTHIADIDGGAKLLLVLLGVTTVVLWVVLHRIVSVEVLMICVFASLVLTGCVPIGHVWWAHRRRLREYLNTNPPHLPCWFCGRLMTQPTCPACKARNVTRTEVADSDV